MAASMVAISRMFLWNVGSILLGYMASHPRRQQISFTSYNHTSVRAKIAVVWEMMPHSFVDGHKYFRGTCCLHFQDRREDSNL
jgi:hypothetical protein